MLYIEGTNMVYTSTQMAQQAQMCDPSEHTQSALFCTIKGSAHGGV